jgi:hypothetical protein
MGYLSVARRRFERGELGVVFLAALAWMWVPTPFLWPQFSKLALDDRAAWADTVVGWVVRWGVVAVAVLALDAHAALIRSDARRVLMLHPVEARRVVLVSLLEVAVRRAPLVLGLLVWIAPVLRASVALWALGAWLLLSAFAIGVAGAAFGCLLAVEAATAPGWRGVLDAVRGQNPREQAAFLYAPGVVLLVAGGAVALSGEGARMVWTGQWFGWIWLAIPWILAVLCAVRVPNLATLGWWRGGVVLADIDARWAALEGPESANAVYLEWAVRWLPSPLRVYALRDLRRGWRSQRTLILAGWVFGVGASVIALGQDAAAVPRASAIAVAGCFVVGAAALRLLQSEPEALRRFIPRSIASDVASAWVVLAWLASVWVLPGAVAIVAHRSPTALAAGIVASGLVVVANLVSRGSIWIYAVEAVVAISGAVWMLGVR